MFRTVRMLTAGLAIAAHLLLAGVLVPHCHANHDSAGDHHHAERHHAPHSHHAQGSHRHHLHGHGHDHRHGLQAPHASHGRHHNQQPHDAGGGVQENCHHHCQCCLADHGSPAAIPPRIERGTDRGIDLVLTAVMPLAATPLAQRAADLPQALGRASHAASRVTSLHDLLPHVLRL